jgi:RND family efflux transporter MFP subunit
MLTGDDSRHSARHFAADTAIDSARIGSYINDQLVINVPAQAAVRLARVLPMSAISARLLIAAAAIATGLLSACSRPEAPPEPVRAVRTLTLGSDTASATHEYAAELRARVESRLGLRVAGRLVSRTAEVGQRVAAGQVLARIDTADLKLALDAAAAAARAAQTNHDFAAAEFERYKALRDQGFIGALELERREATLKAQKATLDQAQAQVQVQSNQASYGALQAPVAGVVVGVDAEVGAVLAAGATVVRVAHDGPRDAVFAVPEDQLPAIRALLGRPGALKVVPWGASAALPATVREIAAAADPATRTFQVKADLGGASVQLGQTATVVIEWPGLQGVSKLPLSAVTQHQGTTSVWLLDRASMTVRLQPIQVAGADGNSVVVSAGLSPGMVVVTAGVHALTPGQKVAFYEAPIGVPPPAPASGPTAAAGR